MIKVPEILQGLWRKMSWKDVFEKYMWMNFRRGKHKKDMADGPDV